MTTTIELPTQSGVTEVVYQTEYTTPAPSSLHLNPPENSTQTNYVKIIRSINPSNVVDIVPSVVKHIQSNETKIERLELIQEISKKLKDEDIVWELIKRKMLNSTISQILCIFSSDSSQSVQFELMAIICTLPESHLTEKLLAKLHSAALSSSPLIRRQSLVLVMQTLPLHKSLNFLLAYLDDDDPRVRTTAIQNLVSAAARGCDVPFSVYHKVIESLSDSHHEVRLHSVELLPYLVKQHRNELIPVPGNTSRTLTLTHHTFVQLCLLMRDMSIAVRVQTARALGSFIDVDPDFLNQTLDKKLKVYMKIIPEGSKVKQEYSAGRQWGGDAPIKTNTGEINIIDPAACGAFIHGMEDEYSDVRLHTIQSVCTLSMHCSQFGAVAIPNLVDMLNDEVQIVRLLAITSLQAISQNVQLLDEQLETVMSVLEESNVEIRQSLHKLLSTCKLNSQVAVRRVLRGLLDNLKKYPQDKSSVFKCVSGVGDNNSSYVALLAPEMLSKHPYLAQTEPNMDDVSYIATMILVFNAAAHNSIIMSMFHEYTPRHYMYIVSLLPDLVPQLSQVHKISKGIKNSSDLTSISTTLNSLLKQFFKLCPTQNLPAMSRILEDIAKIQKCSTIIHPLTKYSSLLIRIILQLFKLRNISRKRQSDGQHRVMHKIKDLVYDVCLLRGLFSGAEEVTSLNSRLVTLYCLQFLRRYVPASQISDTEFALYLDSTNTFIRDNNVNIVLKNDVRFDLFGYLLSLDSIVDSNIRILTANILSPASNTDRINEFPSHLSYSIHIEAQTHHISPEHLAVKVKYPGDKVTVCQPALESQLHNYYENTIFVGSQSWSDPGLISVSLVSPHEFAGEEAAFRRLCDSDKMWLEVSESVELKIHPRIPR